MEVNQEINLTNEELVIANKLHDAIDRNMRHYIKWWTPTRYGWVSEPDKDLVKRIMDLAEQLSVNAASRIGYYGLNILNQLVCHNYYDAVKILLEKGVNPDIRAGEGRGDYVEAHKGMTSLHMACHAGNVEMVKLLLEYGADSTLCDDKGRNCFHFIASEHYPYVINNADNEEIELVLFRKELFDLVKCDINGKDINGNTPFHHLVMNINKNVSTVFYDEFIKRGADIFAKDNENNNALMLAAKNKQINAVAMLSKNKELVNEKNNAGNTALHMSFDEHEFVPAIPYLLTEADGDMDSSNNEGIKPSDLLQKLVDSNWNTAECLKEYLSKRMSIDDYFDMLSDFTYLWYGKKYDDYNLFAYHVARKILRAIDVDDDTELVYIKDLVEEFYDKEAANGFLDVLQEEGYDICMTICDRGTITCIRDMFIEEAWRNMGVLDKFVELGIDLDEAIVNGNTPVNIVVNDYIDRTHSDERKEAFGLMMKYFSKESMETLNNNGLSAVHTATLHRQHNAMRKMIEMGVDVNIMADANGKESGTPLHLACYKQDSEMVKILMDAGADDTILNAEDNTPAYMTLLNDFGKIDTKECLEIYKILNNLNLPNGKYAETVLMRLQTFNLYTTELSMAIIDKCEDIDVRDNDGNTALLIHVDYRCDREVVKYFIKAGADINARNKKGNTVLFYVIKHKDSELARLLIKKGANYNVRNNEGVSAVELAVEKGLEQVLELMTDIIDEPVPTPEDEFDAGDDKDEDIDDEDDEEDDDDDDEWDEDDEDDNDDDDEWDEDDNDDDDEWDEDDDDDEWDDDDDEEEDDDDDSEDGNGRHRVMVRERPDDEDDGDVEIDEEVIDNALRENYRQAVISYSQMYGQERGTYLAGIVTRMQEISMKGLMETNAQEYNELVIEMQRVMLGAI